MAASCTAAVSAKATTRAARLCDLPDDICESFLPYTTNLRQRQRASLFSKGQYISFVKILKTGEKTFDIFAGVFRSQSKNDSPHNVNVTVQDRTISDAFCSCKAGISGQCAHVLAVIYTLRDWILAGLKEVPSDTACTSQPQQWDKPRGQKISAEPVSTMVIAKPGKTTRKRKPITVDFNDNRVSSSVDAGPNLLYLRNIFRDRPIGYLAQDVTETVSTKLGPQLLGSTLATQRGHEVCQEAANKKDLIDGREKAPLIQAMAAPAEISLKCGDVTFPKPPLIPVPVRVKEHESEWSHVKLTLEEARQLAKQTTDQALSSTWHAERKKRITASNFGRFLTRKAPINDSFLGSIFNPKPFVSAPTSYGAANEKVARRMYVNKSKLHVHDCGLIVNPDFPFLAATPDGIVCDTDTGILEIKCPFSIRDMTMSEAVSCDEKKHLVFMEKSGSDIRLKRNHLHWYQVQGQLLVTGAAFCDFVCFTKVDFHVERILPDIPTMTDILTTLNELYFTHVKKFLSKTKPDSNT